VLDQSADGRAFDPRGGGAWTLVLIGSIEGTPVTTSIPATFPSYPRVGVPSASQPVVAAGAVLSPAGGAPAWLVGLAMTAIVGGPAVLALFARRRSGGAKPRAADQVPVP
jgi:hypothetical protein